jgi:hypothetical protein
MIGELLQLAGHFLADLFGLTVGARSGEDGEDQRRRDHFRKVRRMLPVLVAGSLILIGLLLYLISGILDGLGPFLDAPWWGPSGSAAGAP